MKKFLVLAGFLLFLSGCTDGVGGGCGEIMTKDGPVCENGKYLPYSE